MVGPLPNSVGRGDDLQEEVLSVPKAVGHSLELALAATSNPGRQLTLIIAFKYEPLYQR